jgi:ABC-2 type transport system permease protein
MSMSKRRVRAIFYKELREYRHNGNIIVAMVIFPLIFLIQPLLTVLTEAASASNGLAHEHVLLYLLAVPALVPAIRREEFLLGKALAAFVPSLAISYAVLAFFLACVELFAQPGIAPALLRAPDLLAQLLFTPLLAAWSIWVGIAISARSSDVRVAGQLSLLASLPSVAVTTLIALNVIPPTLGLALGAAAVLLTLDGLGWRITSAAFDRERLITGTR